MSDRPLTEADLRALIRDDRYWQFGHPDRPALVARVTEGFRRLYGGEGTEAAGGRIEVPVRAYDRVVDGHPQHVGAYTQSRQAARTREEAQLAQGSATGQAQPQTPTAPRPVVVFVGGGGDAKSTIVQRYYGQFERQNPNRDVRYFSHDEEGAVRAFIDSLPRGTRVSLVGHSWGGNTAAQVAADLGVAGRPVDLLVTIDPVGRGTSADFFSRVRAGAGQWVNVNASGTNRFSLPNIIAGLGGDYGRGPQGYAHTFFNVARGHEDFAGMLESAGPDGRSPLDLVLGRGAAR